MNEIEKRILNRINNQKTIFLHGEWGIGKTFFAKNILYKEIEKKNDVIYMDARIFDQDSSAYDYIAYFAKKNKSKTAKFKEMGKKGAKVFLNGMIFGVNSVAKTNIKYNPIKNEIDLEIQLEEAKDKITIIIDELDRVTPETVLKTLNFVNGISIMNDDLQVIVVGNKNEIESILNLRFGFNKNKKFTHKYFSESISLDDIATEYVQEIIGGTEISESFFKILGIKSNPRDIERALTLYISKREKYGNVFTDGIFLAALQGELSNNSLIFYLNGMRTNNHDLFKCEFKVKIGEKWMNVQIRPNDSFRRTRENTMNDLRTNFRLKRFDEWANKYISK